MRLTSFILALVLYNLTLCSSQIKLNNYGIVKVRFQLYDTVSTGMIAPVVVNEFRIWYKDSLAIEEVKLVNVITDAHGKRSTNSTISHYVFIDPLSKSSYYYKTFSDTAKIIKKYAVMDSFDLDGGWNFFTERSINYSGIPETLNDTVINGINYKQVKFNKINEKTTLPSIGYFRCDKKGTIFKLDKNYSEKLGCPMVILYEFSRQTGKFQASTEIEFISDTLSKQELNVFEVWSNNDKRNAY